MPAVYTHYMIARETLLRLPQNIQDTISHFLPLYFFGAQGADFCFFYRRLNANGKNLGSFLHRNKVYEAFSVIQLFSAHNPMLNAYALGFITHYAADTTFHPYVYELSGNSPLQHTRVENTLDGYFKSNEKSFDTFAEYFTQKPSAKEREELFFLYSSIAAKCGFPTLIKSTFFQAISLFNAYLPYPYAIFSKNNRRFLDTVINKEKRTWRYPAAPTIQSNDNAYELLERSIYAATVYIQEFSNAVARNTPLPRNSFSKNYLTGISP